jgi:hypothetical protein
MTTIQVSVERHPNVYIKKQEVLIFSFLISHVYAAQSINYKSFSDKVNKEQNILVNTQNKHKTRNHSP